MSYVYFVKPYNKNLFKIGSTPKPKRRLSQLQTGCPDKLYLHACIEATQPKELEKSIHSQLNNYHKRGEWFEVDVQIIDDIVWKLQGKPTIYEIEEHLFVVQLHQSMSNFEKPRIEISTLHNIVRENCEEVLNGWRGVGASIPLGVYKTKAEAEAAELHIRRMLDLPYVRSWVDKYGNRQSEEYWLD